jgi:excisionase family DNA binding protein
MSNEPGLRTIAQAAEALCLHPKTVERLIRAGELGAVHIGRRVMVTPDQLASFIKDRTDDVADDVG